VDAVNYLLDTCVLSEYTKNKPDEKVLQWMSAQNEKNLWISDLTLAELRKGIVRVELADRLKFQRLEAWLGVITDRFSTQTLAIDNYVWLTWADLSGASMREGRPLPPMDALLIATATRHDLTIVTRNMKDFSQYPKLFNPWEMAI
jgi:predicted nucleic acid-binding protein